MKARFSRVSAGAGRAHLAAAFGLLLAQFAAGSASADIATPEQKRACTPDVYRLCAGEIPNARAIGRRPVSATPAGQCSSCDFDARGSVAAAPYSSGV